MLIFSNDKTVSIRGRKGALLTSRLHEPRFPRGQTILEALYVPGGLSNVENSSSSMGDNATVGTEPLFLVTDVLVWADSALYEGDAAFRHFFLFSRLTEENWDRANYADLSAGAGPGAGASSSSSSSSSSATAVAAAATKVSPSTALPLPRPPYLSLRAASYMPLNRDLLAELLSETLKCGDAVYCVHEECTYTPGPSPLALVLRRDPDSVEDALEREDKGRSGGGRAGKS